MDKYLNYNDFKTIEDYCIKNCKDLLSQDYKKDLKDFYRGKYKGFLYFKKFNQSIFKNNRTIKKFEYYNSLKEQKNLISNQYHPKKDFINGIKESLYESLNFISILSPLKSLE